MLIGRWVARKLQLCRSNHGTRSSTCATVQQSFQKSSFPLFHSIGLWFRLRTCPSIRGAKRRRQSWPPDVRPFFRASSHTLQAKQGQYRSFTARKTRQVFRQKCLCESSLVTSLGTLQINNEKELEGTGRNRKYCAEPRIAV